MIVQAIGLLDDLDKELNTYAMRVREWYGWHFPEMTRVVADNIQYALTVSTASGELAQLCRRGSGRCGARSLHAAAAGMWRLHACQLRAANARAARRMMWHAPDGCPPAPATGEAHADAGERSGD